MVEVYFTTFDLDLKSFVNVFSLVHVEVFLVPAWLVKRNRISYNRVLFIHPGNLQHPFIVELNMVVVIDLALSRLSNLDSGNWTLAAV